MKMHIEFDMDNAAFEDCREIETVRILRAIAKEIEDNDPIYKKIRDANGNTIGFFEIR